MDYIGNMPELPEVEIVRRGLEPALVGKDFSAVIVNRRDLRAPIPQDFVSALQGQRVLQIRRRGKYILVFMDSGQGFILHLGMSGRISTYAPGEPYKAEKHDHVVFKMNDGAQIVYNDPRRFGMLYLTNEQGWQAEKPFSAMGAEPLGNNFNGPVLAQALEGRRTPVKVALLDQKVVAGVGNIYACEALYDAGIDPRRPACSINGQEAADLAGAIRGVLEKAIAAGGSTLRDYQHTDGTLGYFQHSFSVYDREGDFCPACVNDKLEEGCISWIVQAGRSTFYCHRMQR